MIDKTEALVLRVTPFSRTSHIVTWLTPEHGKIATIVKGACRPKSRFLGQYDLFYTCELLFYTRGRNTLHIIRECSPLRTRAAFRENWLACCCASYVCDLVSRVSPEGHPHPELYYLANSSLNFLAAGTAGLQFLFWFELRLMKTLGLAPQLSKCPACHSDLVSQGSAKSFFSYVRGGILCTNCAKLTDNVATHISPDTLAMMRSWQNAHSPSTVQHTRCVRKQLLEIRKLLGIFISYHLDVMPTSRNIAMDMTQEVARGKAHRTQGT